MIATALAGSVATAAYVWLNERSEALPPELENTLQLRDLPANRWVKYHEERPGNWSRQGHAGMAFDSRRGSLLIFGSDTHGEDWERGENWDNSVHEFQPRLKRWETHYAETGPETYRVDEAGRPIAGAQPPLPWAMHTYDAIEYHPRLDALIVTSTTEHNPRARSVPGVTQQPTWIYDLSTRRWAAFANKGKRPPSFFGGSSAYDTERDVLLAYRDAIWELDAASGEWRRAAEGHHQLHHTMVYAPPRRAAYVFGDYRPTNTVWLYRPGARIGEAGTWEERHPGGDRCPPYGTVPVAYDPTQDLFVLVVDDPDPGSLVPPRPASASTYFYDPVSNAYTKLSGAHIPAVGMNFMMAWDSIHEVVFLVTGGREGLVTVWAMRPHRPVGRLHSPDTRS